MTHHVNEHIAVFISTPPFLFFQRGNSMVTHDTAVLGAFYGDDDFPIEWQEDERDLFWIYDDLHCPNPVSPLFFDIGGWWLTCDHMFRRFGTPFASDWIAKNIN